MALSKNQVQHICLPNAGYQTCRYLSPDNTGYPIKYHCLRQTPQKKIIDEEVNDHLKQLKVKNLSYKNQNVPVGDNCSGYPLLRIIEQGYDIK